MAMALKTGLRKRATDRDWLKKPDRFVLKLAAENVNQDDRTIEVSITEEALARRWYGNLVLGHKKGECRLERILKTGSFLFAHGRDPVYGVLPIGPILDVWLDEKARKYRARLKFDEDEKAELLYQKVLSGSLRGISVGARFYKVLEVEADAEERGFKGPFYLVVDWDITEISLEPEPELIVGVGLSTEEPDIKAVREDGLGSEIDEREGNEMKYKVVRNGVEVEVAEADLTAEERIQLGLDRAPAPPSPPAPGTAPAAGGTLQAKPAESAKEVLAAERQRVKQINAICDRFNVDAKERQSYIDDGLSIAEVNEKVLAKLAADPQRGAIPVVQLVADETDKFRAAAVDGILLRAGVQVAKPAAGADDFRGVRLLELAAICAERAMGRSFRLRAEAEILRAALGFGEHGQFSGTSDFPSVLRDAAHKALIGAYEGVPTTYQVWARLGSLTDFKTAHRVILSQAPALEEIRENGEFRVAQFSDLDRTIRLGTFGRAWGLSRQAIVNDDMDAFSKLPQMFAQAARRLVNHEAYSIWLGNPVIDGAALFHANHGNLAGAGAAPSVQTLGAGRAAMAIQRDISGNQVLGIQPSYLLVPVAISTAAEQLIASTVDPAATNNTPNAAFVRRLTVVSDAEMDAIDTAAWYLFAAQNAADTVEVAFLNGRDMPTIESQLSFDILGIKFRVYIDFGVALLDWRAMYMNPGQ